MERYYQLLQVSRGCTKDDIKKAFHRLAHIHHPDKGGDKKKFQEINEAYQWLVKNHGGLQQKTQVVYNYQSGTNGVFVRYTSWNG